jgi:hypothetical protein
MFVGTVRRRRRCHSAPRASSLLRRARPFFYSHQTRSANHASCPLVYSSHDILVRLVVACARAARAHGIQKAARWLLPRILKLYSHKQLLLSQFIYYSQAWMRSHKHCTTQRLGCVHATKQCHRPAPARPPGHPSWTRDDDIPSYSLTHWISIQGGEARRAYLNPSCFF